MGIVGVYDMQSVRAGEKRNLFLCIAHQKLPHIPKYAPVHEWRAVYAREFYMRLARPVEEIPRQEQYICRGERAGIIYDKRAMQAVSKMLGHARLDVVTCYLG